MLEPRLCPTWMDSVTGMKYQQKMWPFKPKPIRLEVVRRLESKLRLADWQSDPALCAATRKLLADPNVQLILAVLRNEHPARTALPYGVSIEDRMVLQARSEGYEMVFSNLEAMTMAKVAQEPPEAVFEAI